MGFQVPQGVVGGLVVAGVPLGRGAVLQEGQRHRQDDVTQVKVLVQHLGKNKVVHKVIHNLSRSYIRSFTISCQT